MSNVWRCLEILAGGNHVAAEWANWSGDQFGPLRSAYLRDAQKRAGFIPCPQGCGCEHEIVPRAGGKLAAVCRCVPWNCEDFAVTAEQAALLKLNTAKLGRDIAKAFGCDAKDTNLKVAGAWQVAAFGGAGVPVVLSIQSERTGFARAVTQLVAQLREQFILLAPTSRFLDGISLGLLKQAKAGFFDLESNLVLTPSGTLKTRKSGGELFSPYAPKDSEPVAEDQARQLFALVEKLESGRRLKNPSVMEVFRLYCIKGKTTDQIVAGGRYSKGTIINRLKAIRRATNKDPDELRAFSPYLQRIEETITDSRAAYIHRKALVHDNKEADDES
jgi:hypothetical protein